MERFAEDADLIGELRERMWSAGRLVSRVREGQQEAGAKFADYFDFAEPFTRLPSHRILAVFRGEKEEILDLTMDAQDETADVPVPAGGARRAYEESIARRFGVSDAGRPADRWLAETVRWAWRTRILVHLGVDLRMRLWQRAEDEAVRVFAANLRDLLLAAPAGARPTMGLDPGFRTGVKVAVTDRTGKAVATETIYPHEPRRRWDESIAILARLAAAHGVELIAIGNGTASRETDRLAADLIKTHPELHADQGGGLRGRRVGVLGVRVRLPRAAGHGRVAARRGVDRAAPAGPAGRAGQDRPEVHRRGPVPARRLREQAVPLARRRGRGLPSTRSASTSTRPPRRCWPGCPGSAPGSRTASWRTATPPGRSAAAGRSPRCRGWARRPSSSAPGFLRIPGGDDPLDASSVHPEAYPVVRRILTAAGTTMPGLIGNAALLRSLTPQRFADERFGVPTVTDILRELEKPGRDPRPAFRTAAFADGVETMADLVPGMLLEGVVTNVAAFGAFVDIGVHQDGLVHVSAMSRNFVSDPREVAKPGDVVRVKVLGVDIPRKRISLTLRLDDEPDGRGADSPSRTGRNASPSGPGDRGEGPGRGGAPAPRDGRRGSGGQGAGQRGSGGQGAGQRGSGGQGSGQRGSGGQGSGQRGAAGRAPAAGKRGAEQRDGRRAPPRRAGRRHRNPAARRSPPRPVTGASG